MTTVLNQARYILLNRMVSPAFAFVLLVWIGRHSDALLGQYALVTTFYFVLQTLPLLGLTPFVLRETARAPHRAGAVFGTVGMLAMLACAAIDLLVYRLAPLTPYAPAMQEAVRVVGWAIVPGILGFLAELILIGLHRARWAAYTSVLENVARLGASIVVLRLGGDIVDLMWVLFATRCIALLSYAQAGLVDLGRLRPHIDPELLRKIRPVLPVFLAGTILSLVISRMDYIVLSHYQDDAHIGYYAIAYRLLEIVQMAVTALLMALFPRFARLFTTDRRQFAAAARMAFVAVLALLVLIAFLGVIWADRYAAWLFARQYPHPVQLAQGFAALIIVVGMDVFMTGLLNAADRQADDLRAQAGGAGVYAALLLLLIPSWGAYGALIALAVAVAAQLSLRIFAYRARIGPLHCRKPAAWTAGFAGVALALGFGMVDGTDIAQVVVASAVALVLLPLLLIPLGLLHSGRLLVAHWPRSAAADVRPIDTLAGLLDHIAYDLRAWCHWRARGSRGGDVARIHNHGPLAVVLYRIARCLWLRKRTRAARIVSHVNLVLTKADVPPWADVAPGLVLSHTCGTIIVGKLGADSALGAWCAVGGRGNTDVGAGPGMPLLGARTKMEHRAVLQGPIRCDDGIRLAPHVWISHRHQMEALKKGA